MLEIEKKFKLEKKTLLENNQKSLNDVAADKKKAEKKAEEQEKKVTELKEQLERAQKKASDLGNDVIKQVYKTETYVAMQLASREKELDNLLIA